MSTFIAVYRDKNGAEHEVLCDNLDHAMAFMRAQRFASMSRSISIQEHSPNATRCGWWPSSRLLLGLAHEATIQGICRACGPVDRSRYES